VWFASLVVVSCLASETCSSSGFLLCFGDVDGRREELMNFFVREKVEEGLLGVRTKRFGCGRFVFCAFLKKFG